MQEYIDEFRKTGKIPPRKILGWFCKLLDGAFIDKEDLANFKKFEQKYEQQLAINKELEFELQSVHRQLTLKKDQVENLNHQLNELRNIKEKQSSFAAKFEEKKKSISDQQGTNDTSNVNSILEWED